MSDDDDKAKIRQWLQSGAQKKGAADPAAGAADPGIMEQVGSGLARGAYSNVAGLETAASKIPGMGFMAPWKSTQEWLNRPDRGGWETAGRLGGEYGSLMIPGLDAPAGAGMLGRLAVDAAKGAVGGMAGTGDPQGAESGAATAGGSTLARTLGRAALSRVPAPLRWLGDKAATVGGIMAAENMMHGKGRGGGYVPYWYIGHSLPSALSALAAIALGAPPAAQGRAGAELWKDYQGEGDQ